MKLLRFFLASLLLCVSAPAFSQSTFSESDLQKVLQQLRSGFQGHNSDRVLSAFDSNRVADYLPMRDRLEQFFSQYDGFRLRYRIVEVKDEGEKGSATIEWQMEADPRQDNRDALRRDTQVQLQLARTSAGWRIIDLQPRTVLAP